MIGSTVTSFSLISYWRDIELCQMTKTAVPQRFKSLYDLIYFCWWVNVTAQSISAGSSALLICLALKWVAREKLHLFSEEFLICLLTVKSWNKLVSLFCRSLFHFSVGCAFWRKLKCCKKAMCNDKERFMLSGIQNPTASCF